jgi:thymidylate synthase
MLYADEIYKRNLYRILTEGTMDENPRPRYESDGEPAHSKFITQVFEEYDLNAGELPITTLRPIHIEKGIEEIRWIYQEQSNELDVLEDKYGIKWWRPWDIGDGTIGQRYGATVSRYDLINNLLTGLKSNPYSRRHMINLWQEKDLEETEGLPPCAFQTLWSVRKYLGEYYLDCTLTQRSSDYAVAGHINMIQYVALQMMVAHECGFKVGKFARFTQNLHIYSRHKEQAYELLEREPSDIQPKLILNAEGKSFYDITAKDFELVDYHPVKPQLKFELGI